MIRIDDVVSFVRTSGDGRHTQQSGFRLVQPAIPEFTANGVGGRIPAWKILWIEFNNANPYRNSNYQAMIGNLQVAPLRVGQNFHECTGVATSRVNCFSSWRCPTCAESRRTCAVAQRMDRARDAINIERAPSAPCNHTSGRQTVLHAPQDLFNLSCAEFGSRRIERLISAQFGMGRMQEFKCVLLGTEGCLRERSHACD